MSRKPHLLKDLVETSKSLPTAASDIGSIELGSTELKKRIHNLRNLKDGNFTKAHYLLANSGIIVEDLENEIKSIEIPNSTETSLVPTNHHFDETLISKKEENILAAIEQSLTTASRDFDNFINQNITMDWRKRKNEIYESFGFGTKYLKSNNKKALSSNNKSSENNNNKVAVNNWGKITVGHSVLGPKSGGEFSDLPKDAKLTNVNELSIREKFEKYAVIIYELNNSREQMKPVNVIKLFKDASKNATDNKTKQIYECWKILEKLINDNDDQQIYFDQYKNFLDKDSKNLRNKIVKNSIKYLELQFLKFVDTIYQKKINSKENEDNGLPTHLNKMKYFLKSQNKNLFEKEGIKKNLLIVNDIPIWALIYYLIRAGCYSEALEIIEENSNIFKNIDSNFINYFKNFTDSSTTTNNYLQIQKEFNNNIKNSENIDPFKYAIYKIMGKCDLSKKSLPKIFQTTEDWLWINFILINENDKESSKFENYSLIDFQKNLISYGANYFNTSNNNSTFIKVLLLGGLYELAIKYSFSINELEAVHLAIGLGYYGLLRVNNYDSVINNKNNLVESNSQGLYEINYPKLIGYYTRSFRSSDTIVAFEYLLMINIIKGENYHKLTLEAIRELVIETKEFKILLGTINKDGTRYPGRIENRQELLYNHNNKLYLNEIIEQAAKRIEEEGRIYDCLYLYQLSENYNQVINITNRLLSDLINSSDINQSINKSEDYLAIELGEKILKIYELNPSSLKISMKSKEVLKKLLIIIKIKENFASNKNFEKVLKLIEELNLVPISINETLSSIRIKCQEINQSLVDYNLLKNIGDLLIISMICINKLIENYQSGNFENLIMEKNLQELKKISKQLMIFAGMIQSKLSKEIYIKLTDINKLHV